MRESQFAAFSAAKGDGHTIGPHTYRQGLQMLAARCIALFMSGAVLGATIDHWYMGSRLDLGIVGASVLIAILVFTNMRTQTAKV